jgi:hypothetical protein
MASESEGAVFTGSATTSAVVAGRSDAAVGGGGANRGSLEVLPASATASVQALPSQYRYSCRRVGSRYQPAVGGLVIIHLLGFARARDDLTVQYRVK